MDLLNEVSEKLKTSDRPVLKKIFSANGTNLIAIGLKKGVELKEHTAPSKAKLMVIQGVIDFHINEKTLRFNVQDTFEIPLKVKHAVVGVEDAIFLLILS